MKQEVSKIAASYMACFNKQDASCIAALYTKDGFIINPAGKHIITEYYGGAFKAGMNKLEATVEEAWQIDNDTPGAMGKFLVTGKNDKGEPMDSVGIWTRRLCQARWRLENPNADGGSKATAAEDRS
ncbi:nuclear transport factor 2 family protein [Bradyrhizobium sp. URHC0002]